MTVNSNIFFISRPLFSKAKIRAKYKNFNNVLRSAYKNGPRISAESVHFQSGRTLHDGFRGHFLVEGEAGVHFLLELVGEFLRDFRLGARKGLVAVLGVDVFRYRNRGLLAVQRERSLALRDKLRIVTEERPVTGIDGHLLVGALAAEVESVVDARAVRDDERRSVMRFGFLEDLERLNVIRAYGDAADVNVLVAPRDESEVLLACALARGGEQSDRAAVSGLGSLSTRVGIHFGVEHEDVHVFACGHHVIQSAVADIVCPAVTAHDPHGLLDEVIRIFGEGSF